VIGLGIDQGARHAGWCRLDLTKRPKLIDCGTCAPEQIAELSSDGVDLVAIEKPAGRVIEGRSGEYLIEAAWNGGDSRRLFVERGCNVVTVSHSQWVTALIGAFQRGKQDALVKEAILRLVEDWQAKSSTHARDAAGVLVIGARIWQRRRVA
jgi:hypothetical protein